MQTRLYFLLLPLFLACQPTSKPQQVLLQQNLMQTLDLLENDFELNIIQIKERAYHNDFWKPILNLSEQITEVYQNFEQLADSLRQPPLRSKEMIKILLETKLKKSEQQLIQVFEQFYSPGFLEIEVRRNKTLLKRLQAEISIPNSLNYLNKYSLLEYQNILYQLQLDVLQASMKTFNLIEAHFGYGRIHYSYFPTIHHHTAYLQQGDPYQNNIYLGDIHRPQQDQLTINGKLVATKRGKASFQYIPKSLSDTSFTAVWTFFNFTKNEMDTLRRQFNIKIIPKAQAQLEMEGRNLLAKLIPHPYAITPTLEKGQKIQPSPNIKLNQQGEDIGYLNVKSTAIPGDTAFISIIDTITGKQLAYQQYRITPSPSPQLRLTNNRYSGLVRMGEMRAQRGIMALILNYDIDLRCQTKQFEFHHFPAKGEPLHVINQGGTFTGAVLQVIQAAQAGDSYLFTDIQFRCPGDLKTRSLYSLNFVVE